MFGHHLLVLYLCFFCCIELQVFRIRKNARSRVGVMIIDDISRKQARFFCGHPRYNVALKFNEER